MREVQRKKSVSLTGINPWPPKHRVAACCFHWATSTRGEQAEGHITEFVSCWSIHLSHFVTELRIHHLYLLITVLDSFQFYKCTKNLHERRLRIGLFMQFMQFIVQVVWDHILFYKRLTQKPILVLLPRSHNTNSLYCYLHSFYKSAKKNLGLDQDYPLVTHFLTKHSADHAGTKKVAALYFLLFFSHAVNKLWAILYKHFSCNPPFIFPLPESVFLARLSHS